MTQLRMAGRGHRVRLKQGKLGYYVSREAQDGAGYWHPLDVRGGRWTLHRAEQEAEKVAQLHRIDYDPEATETIGGKALRRVCIS